MIIWWLVPVLVVPAFFVGTFIHEGSHAIVGVLQGRKLKTFKIWPHRAFDKRFFWGRVAFETEIRSTPEPPARRALRALAPFISQSFLLVVGTTLSRWPDLSLLHSSASSSSIHSRVLTVVDVLIVTIAVDLVHGYLGVFTKNRDDVDNGFDGLGIRSGRKLIAIANIVAIALLTTMAILPDVLRSI